VEAKAPLEGDAKSVGVEYFKTLSEETIQSERDEFIVWSGVGSVTPATANHLLELSPMQVADEIMQIERSWAAGKMLQDYVQKRSLSLSRL
jgi:hypothetical protein